TSMSPEDAALPKFQQYLTVRGMMARAVVYFLIWFLLQFQLNRWGSWQDQRDEPDIIRSRRYQKLAGPGFIIYSLTITLAATDWVMSLDPHWYSTMFGLIIIVGDRKSTRLNSSHVSISYAVFCLKKKSQTE